MGGYSANLNARVGDGTTALTGGFEGANTKLNRLTSAGKISGTHASTTNKESMHFNQDKHMYHT
jgi:hypothetical protein